jgi:hypothetical protein
MFSVPALNSEYAAGLSEWQHGSANALPPESAFSIPLLDGWRQLSRTRQRALLMGGGRCEFPLGIEGHDVVAARAVGHVELLAGQAFIQKAGSARLLSGGLGSDPGLDVRGREHREQTRERLQVHAFVFAGNPPSTQKRPIARLESSA